MLSSISTRVVLGILCLVALFSSTAASASPLAHTYPVFAPVMADDDGRDDKHLPTRPGASTPKRKPVRKGIVGEIPPIKTLPIRPVKNPFQPAAFNDPIRFTMTANKDSVAVGEEVEITIRAELLPITSSMMFVFEEQKGFSLKLLMPEGFVQTGGNYYDYVGADLRPDNPIYSITIKGYSWEVSQRSLCFELLRGRYNQASADLFVRKSNLCIPVKKQGGDHKARRATSQSTNLPSLTLPNSLLSTSTAVSFNPASPTVCPGGSVNVTASCPSGSNASWTNLGTSITQSLPSGTYTVNCFVPADNSIVATGQITVSTNQNVSTSSPTGILHSYSNSYQLCAGQYKQLEGTGCPTGESGESEETYLWTRDNAFFSESVKCQQKCTAKCH